ncbi:hypothetical protein ACVRXQ_06035 [Streptococcus panodentis]|uniref:Uncharacterized protein n=1 Tax=Streptococcus panodentis TaxID=1581472 RepID=A0ABS5AVM8_9STRE|nr:hypothetical protein [Streptococcus panodentis]MBP2620336.1 hypothetical protein [Streptococcus panodentis]
MTNLSLLLKSQLQEKEDLTELLRRLVILIPNRFFYAPDIYTEYYQFYQIDISDSVRKVRQYKRGSAQERTEKEMLSSLIQLYHEELEDLANRKRQRLLELLLQQGRQDQKASILALAAKYHIEKWLLSLESER